MQVGIDVKYMHTNFSGRALPGFGDIATSKNSQISLSEHGLYRMSQFVGRELMLADWR